MYYEITEEAHKDLEDIYEYGVEHWGITKAKEYDNYLYSMFEYIATNQVALVDLGKGVYSYVAREHKIVLTKVGNRLEIIQVIRVLGKRAVPANHI